MKILLFSLHKINGFNLFIFREKFNHTARKNINLVIHLGVRTYIRLLSKHFQLQKIIKYETLIIIPSYITVMNVLYNTPI